MSDQLIEELQDLNIELGPNTDLGIPLIDLNYSGDPDYQKIPSLLSKFSVIEQLTIRNSIWAHLPDTLFGLENVKRIKLFLSNVTSVNGIEQMTSLISLGIYSPNLVKLPANFGNLVKLKFLAIQAEISSFPSSILDIETLKTIYLDSETLKSKFADDLNLQKLVEKTDTRFASFF